MSDRVRKRAKRAGRSTSRELGAFLLEALIAMLLFAFGVVAIVALQGRAVRDVNEAQFRAEAIQLVESGLALMRASAPATLYASFDSREDGPGYRAILERAKRLPGVADAWNAPRLTVADGPSAGSRRVDITVFWQAPGESMARRHRASGVVGGI